MSYGTINVCILYYRYTSFCSKRSSSDNVQKGRTNYKKIKL